MTKLQKTSGRACLIGKNRTSHISVLLNDKPFVSLDFPAPFHLSHLNKIVLFGEDRSLLIKLDTTRLATREIT